MTKYKCDLHVHSCLSPCGDDDMTPANIAGMAVINSLNVVALTDHNTSKNCPAFFAQAKAHGIIPIAGMELTTAEDIHVVCLFPTLESAMEFDRFVETKRIKFPNKPEIFGHQYVMDEDDNVVGEEEDLLINATTLSLEEAFDEVLSRGGVSYPAHIDRASNGIISMLGTFPDEPKYTAFELNSASSLDEHVKKFPIIKNLSRTVSSDAHYLWDISEDGYEIEIDDEPYSSALVRQKTIDYLLGK
ncbi:MAG: PHP domain-containing protein [Clostridia bacterium]|nr:PHP domain-containing protein [Clostridia bacterium]